MTAQQAGDAHLVSSGPSFEIWAGRKGRFRADWHSDGNVRYIVHGHGHGGFAEPSVRKYDDAIKVADKFIILIDFWNMPTYDTDLRVQMQEWGVQHRPRVAGLYVATRSRVVRMGLAVANLAMGLPTRAITSAEEFAKYCERYGFDPNPSMTE